MQPAVDVSPLRRAAGARALSVRQAEHDAEVTTLLEAAYRLIRRRGVVEPGVREVVAEAGLANRAFYRHFATKDEFWLVLVEDVQARLAAEVRAAVMAEKDPVDRLKAWMNTVLEQPSDADVALVGRPFVVHGARLREAHPEVYLTTGAVLLDILEEAIASATEGGQLHSDDPRADARSIFSLTMFVMQSHVLDRTIPSPTEKAAIVGFALRALQ